MKLLTFMIVCLTGLLILSCNDTSSPDKKESATKLQCDSMLSLMRYPLDTAIKAIDSFDSISRRLLDTLPIQSYTIHAFDLLTAMGMPCAESDSILKKLPYTHVRVYLAYRMDSAGIAVKKFKLFIVPVDGADLGENNGGTDMVLDSAGKIQPLSYEGTRYVLDLNAPCPRTCPGNGIMEHQQQ